MTQSFADHFSAIAKQYATYRPSYPQALVDALVDRSPAGTAWDVGCGSGQLSVALADRFDHVVASDPSREQIAAAIRHPKVEYTVARAEDSGLPDASVAVVVAAQAAHWFVWDAFLAEAGRVAQPGALVALVSYGILVIDGDDANAIVARYYHDDAGPHWPPEREHVANGYRDLQLPWPAVAAPDIAMTASWTREELLGYIGTWSATAKLVRSGGEAKVRALHAALSRVWPGGEARTISWPLTLRMARR